MRIACVTYRSWAIEIYDRLEKEFYKKNEFLIFRTKEEFDSEKLKSFNPNIILWYGWSWMVKDFFIDNCTCIMLHPSPLPKYRGGSPLQNQIINNEKESCVTIFRMTKKIDDGDIYKQIPFSLEGSLEEIFSRITEIGFFATLDIINGKYNLTPQKHEEATLFKRREPKDSEITLNEIKKKPALFLHNKIRMLNDPYPNAYILTSDNKKLYILKSRLD